MDRHSWIVANGFRVAGCALGLPSTVALVYMVWARVGLYSQPPPSADGATDIATYGLVGLLLTGVNLAGKLLGPLGSVFVVLVDILIATSLIAVVLSVALFLTGRGLGSHAPWARIAGSSFSVVSLAFSVGWLVLLRRGPNLAGLLPLSASVYILWVLSRTG
jgi:hypothetical protein